MDVKYKQNTTKISQWNPLFAMLTKTNQQNFKKRTVDCGNKLIDRRSVTWVYLVIGLRADLSLLQFELAGDRQTEIKTFTLGFAQISHTRQASNPAGKCKVERVQMTAALCLMYKVKSSLGELFFFQKRVKEFICHCLLDLSQRYRIMILKGPYLLLNENVLGPEKNSEQDHFLKGRPPR